MLSASHAVLDANEDEFCAEGLLMVVEDNFCVSFDT